MNAMTLELELPAQQYNQLAKAAKLRQQTIRELAEMAIAEWLRQQTISSTISRATPAGKSFLLNISGLGASAAGDIAERDEDILAAELDPIHGWTVQSDERAR